VRAAGVQPIRSASSSRLTSPGGKVNSASKTSRCGPVSAARIVSTRLMPRSGASAAASPAGVRGDASGAMFDQPCSFQLLLPVAQMRALGLPAGLTCELGPGDAGVAHVPPPRESGQEFALRAGESGGRGNGVAVALFRGRGRAGRGGAVALIQLARDTEAIAVANRAIQQNSNFTPAWRALSAALALSGHLDEARNAMSQVMELDPTCSISSMTHRVGYVQKARVRLFEGWRQAGMRE
jgi:hypothetical protein